MNTEVKLLVSWPEKFSFMGCTHCRHFNNITKRCTGSVGYPDSFTASDNTGRSSGIGRGCWEWEKSFRRRENNG